MRGAAILIQYCYISTCRYDSIDIGWCHHYMALFRLTGRSLKKILLERVELSDRKPALSTENVTVYVDSKINGAPLTSKSQYIKVSDCLTAPPHGTCALPVDCRHVVMK